MPTVSELFAQTGRNQPDYYATTNRPNNYRYVGGQVSVLSLRADDAMGVLEDPQFQAQFQPQFDAQFQHDVPPPGAIRRILLSDPERVPDAVDALMDRGIESSPHHVYVLGNHTQIGPADAPRNLADVPQWAGEVSTRLHDAIANSDQRPTAVVIDTGILSQAHTPFPEAALAAAPDYEPDGVPGNPNDPVPPYVGHGTFVAGCILRQAPTARLVMVRPDNMKPTVDNDSLSVSDDDLAVALARAVALASGNQDIPESAEGAAAFASIHADFGTDSVPAVLNLSLAGPVHSADSNETFSQTRAVLTVWIEELGTKVVAAAGNEHSSAEYFPGAFDDVICVGASDEYGHIAEFSNYGPWVNMYAPGVDTESWFIATNHPRSFHVNGKSRRNDSAATWSGYAQWSGTSFATPYVAGLIIR